VQNVFPLYDWTIKLLLLLAYTYNIWRPTIQFMSLSAFDWGWPWSTWLRPSQA